MDQKLEILDSASALASVGGDAEFLSEIVGLVEAAWPALLTGIRHGLETADLNMVEAKARLAKAAAAYVSAPRVGSVAVELQSAAARGNGAAAQRLAATLEAEVEKLQSALVLLRRSILPGNDQGADISVCSSARLARG